VYNRYVIVLVSWANTEGSPESSLNCDRQQFGKFRGALRIVTDTRAGKEDRLDGHAVNVGLSVVGRAALYTATRSRSVDRTGASDYQLYSRRTV